MSNCVRSKTSMQLKKPTDYDSILPAQYIQPCFTENPGRVLNTYSESKALQSCDYGMVTRKHHARSFQCQSIRPTQEENGYRYHIEPQAKLAP